MAGRAVGVEGSQGMTRMAMAKITRRRVRAVAACQALPVGSTGDGRRRGPWMAGLAVGMGANRVGLAKVRKACEAVRGGLFRLRSACEAC